MVFECLAAVDEYHGDLVVVLLPEFGVGVDVNLAPVEGSLGLELGKGFLDYFAEMAIFAGINDHFMHRDILNAGYGCILCCARGLVAGESEEGHSVRMDGARR